MTLDELIKAFYKANPEKNEETRRKVKKFISSGSGSFMKDKEAENLSKKDLEEMRAKIKESGSKNVTANKYQAYILAIYNKSV